VLSTQQKIEALSGLIRVNDDEESKGGQLQGESMVASYVPGGIQSGLTDVREQ